LLKKKKEKKKKRGKKGEEGKRKNERKGRKRDIQADIYNYSSISRDNYGNGMRCVRRIDYLFPEDLAERERI